MIVDKSSAKLVKISILSIIGIYFLKIHFDSQNVCGEPFWTTTKVSVTR